MKKPTSPKPPRPTSSSRNRRTADRRSGSQLPDISDVSAGTSRLTFGDVVDACLLTALLPLFVGQKVRGIFHELDKSGYFMAEAVMEFLLSVSLAVAGVGVGAVTWGVLKALSVVAAKLNRRKYLPRERERRRALARERRRIRRRTTLNPAPTTEGLLEAWAHARESPSSMIRFGSMLCDLEAYVDNSLIHDENGEICGRRPGIRGWLRDNCPELAAKYKTVMGYKAMANKFRQAMGMSDPYPASMALDLVEADDAALKADNKAEDDCQNMVRSNDGKGKTRKAEEEEVAREAEVYRVAKTVGGWGEEERQNTVRRMRAFLADCGRTARSVAAAIDVRVHPDAVPRIVEIAERREQGLPSRNGPMAQLARMMA